MCVAQKDFYAINPKGNVPALVLDDGTLLNENVAVLLYLGDRKPEAGLVPPAGTPGYYAVVNALAFVSSEMHASFGPLFANVPSAEARALASSCATRALPDARAPGAAACARHR